MKKQKYLLSILIYSMLFMNDAKAPGEANPGEPTGNSSGSGGNSSWNWGNWLTIANLGYSFIRDIVPPAYDVTRKWWKSHEDIMCENFNRLDRAVKSHNLFLAHAAYMIYAAHDEKTMKQYHFEIEEKGNAAFPLPGYPTEINNRWFESLTMLQKCVSENKLHYETGNQCAEMHHKYMSEIQHPIKHKSPNWFISKSSKDQK